MKIYGNSIISKKTSEINVCMTNFLCLQFSTIHTSPLSHFHSFRFHYDTTILFTKHRKLLLNTNALKWVWCACVFVFLLLNPRRAANPATMAPISNRFHISTSQIHTHMCTHQIIIVNNLSLLILIDFGYGYGKVFVLRHICTHTHTPANGVINIPQLPPHTHTHTHTRQN